MNFQGNIPASAWKIADDLMVDTQWQKYIVYDLIITLAINYRDTDWPPFDRDDQKDANHKSTDAILDSDEADLFRRRYGTKKGAGFFRHSMYVGSCVLEAFNNNALPPPLTQAHVYADIEDFMGKNAKFAKGLEKLRKRIVGRRGGPKA